MILITKTNEYAHLESPVHALDGRVKIAIFFSIVFVSLSTPADAFWCFGFYALVIFVFVVLSKVPFWFYAKRVLFFFPFIFLMTVLMLFISEDGSGYFDFFGIRIYTKGALAAWNIWAKSIISVSSLLVLSATTPFAALMRAFRSFHVPKIFTDLASFTYRYIFIIPDEAMRMKRAGDSRAYRPRWVWHSKTVGHIIGVLLLRSYERSERIYAAMCARGFNGKFYFEELPGLRRRQILFSVLLIVLLIGVRVFAA